MTTVPHGQTPGNRLVILAPNWLGDAVMALPAIADVRRSGQHGSIVVAARPSIAPLFALVDEVDGSVGVSVTALGGDAFDSALLLPNSFRAALTVWRAGIPERCGYGTQGRRALLTRAIDRGVRSHQVTYYQRLVNELGYPSSDAPPLLRVPASVRDAGARLLSASGWNGSTALVAFAPGAANGRAKQWAPSSYAAVASGLVNDGAVVVLVGAPGDAGAGQELVAALGGSAATRIVNLIGRTDLPMLASVLVHCQALVCNDSGGMHLAAALGVNVISMFGPSNERETRPLSIGRTTVLTHDVWCRPCMLRECPLDHRCMTGITVAAVLAATRAHLTARPIT